MKGTEWKVVATSFLKFQRFIHLTSLLIFYMCIQTCASSLSVFGSSQSYLIELKPLFFPKCWEFTATRGEIDYCIRGDI